MDVDFWASRVHSSKYLTALQAARVHYENHLSFDESEADDDARAFFPCPYCYVDIELRVLRTHLQEEHCFDVRNAVCPVCAANLGKDVVGHFTVQHAHLLKRRRKSQRSGFQTSSSAMLGKELQELGSFLGVTSASGRGNTPDPAPNPLLSPFLCSVSLSDGKVGQETSSKDDVSSTCEAKSMEPSLSDESQGLDFQERKQRAEFFQHLIVSTIF